MWQSCEPLQKQETGNKPTAAHSVQPCALTLEYSYHVTESTNSSLLILENGFFLATLKNTDRLATGVEVTFLLEATAISLLLKTEEKGQGKA